MEPPLQRLPREFRRPREELRMLVVMAPQLDGPRDTSVAIIEEALGRGLRVDVCDNDDLQFEPDGAAAEAACVLTAGIEGMELTPPSRTLLTRYNVILYRKVPFTIEALHATLLLEHARETALMVNDPRGMREANDKLFALRFPSFTRPLPCSTIPPRFGHSATHRTASASSSRSTDSLAVAFSSFATATLTSARSSTWRHKMAAAASSPRPRCRWPSAEINESSCLMESRLALCSAGQRPASFAPTCTAPGHTMRPRSPRERVSSLARLALRAASLGSL
jgi:hypothetical protein